MWRRCVFCLDERGSRKMHTQASALTSLLAQKPDGVIEVEIEQMSVECFFAERHQKMPEQELPV